MFRSVNARASALAVLFALLSAAPFRAAAAEISPAEVDAVYKITINGFGIGEFRFSSVVTPDQYTLDTDVELSALLGVFRWKGVTRSSGTIVADAPSPAGFLFEFESSSRSGSIRMGFDQGSVETLSVLPAAARSPDTVPLREQDLKSVLDPLSAILALTHVSGTSPCARRLPVFDGTQRFDLALSYRRQVPISDRQPEMAIVCRVKYVPIAGYRENEETRNLADNTGIEITFRPVPSAKLMLPQAIVIPASAGLVELTLVKVGIKTPDRGLIALVN